MPRIPIRLSYPMKFFFWLQEKITGPVPISMKIWARSPKVYFAFLQLWKTVDRKGSPLSPQLRSLITLRVSQINQCQLCVHLSAKSLTRRGGEEKIDSLDQWRQSALFTDAEKAALEYAEAVVKIQVSEKIFQTLKTHYNEDQIMELTALVSFQTCSNLFNNALEIK